MAGITARRVDRQCAACGSMLSPFRNARILIVDDEEKNVDLLRRILNRFGFSRLESTTDSREAAALYVRHRPDLILLDLHMPHLNGLDVMAQLNQIAEATYLPILVLSGDVTPEMRQEAVSRGAKDFVSKPFQQDEIILRIKTLLQTRQLYLQIQSQNQLLEAKVRERTKALEEAQIEIVERLAVAAEFRDDNTGQHTQRVGQLSALLARHLGLPDSQITLIRRAAPLHDVGKIGVPDSILLKFGKLTTEEFAVVKTHTLIGARILSGGKFPLLRLAEEIAFNPRTLGWRRIHRHSCRRDPARRTDRGGRRRVRRADTAASLQGSVASAPGRGGNRSTTQAAVRSGSRGCVPEGDRTARCGPVRLRLTVCVRRQSRDLRAPVPAPRQQVQPPPPG